MADNNALFGAYLALGVQALLPIVVGSFKSLKTPAATVARRKKAALASSTLLDGQEEDEDEDEMEETMTLLDSLLFPVLGSVALLSMWAILKYVGKEWINLFLGVYCAYPLCHILRGPWLKKEACQSRELGCLHSNLSIVDYILRQTRYTPSTYHFRVSSGIRQVFHLPIKLPSLLLLPLSIALPALYLPLSRPYLLSNLLAFSLSSATLSLLRLDSFPTAFTLLSALLVYDIFWVFATPVMVTVARGIDAPIKILASKSPLFSKTPEFAMLGLGDIVVPGLIIALSLRFDLARHAAANPSSDITSRSGFSKPYFLVGIVSYIVGLATTMGIMHYTKHAQPALLYLSPACIAGPTLLALARGEFTQLWKWSDGREEDKVVDDTIERPSEAAIKAREAAKAEAGANADGSQTPAEEVIEDDSWMDGGVVTGEKDDGSRARRKKSGKRK
ncbi:minor histocompatibility antigen H13, partial [Tremellales sp. Uapishka_1]